MLIDEIKEYRTAKGYSDSWEVRINGEILFKSMQLTDINDIKEENPEQDIQIANNNESDPKWIDVETPAGKSGKGGLKVRRRDSRKGNDKKVFKLQRNESSNNNGNTKTLERQKQKPNPPKKSFKKPAPPAQKTNQEAPSQPATPKKSSVSTTTVSRQKSTPAQQKRRQPAASDRNKTANGQTDSAEPVKTCKLALASICCAVLCIPGILAVTFGHISLWRIKRNPSLAGREMAIAGLALAYFTHTMLILTITFAREPIMNILNLGGDNKEYIEYPLTFKNNGFESGTFSGWHVPPRSELMIISSKMDNSPDDAYQGKHFVWGGGEVKETGDGVFIDYITYKQIISEHAAGIDTGEAMVTLGAWGCGGGNAKDGTYIEVIFHENEWGEGPIGEPQFSNKVESAGIWEEMVLRANIPPKTRSMEIRLIVYRSKGNNTHAGFDFLEGSVTGPFQKSIKIN